MKRSNFSVMAQLVTLVRPLAGYMAAAVTMGLMGHLCAALIPVLGAAALLRAAGLSGVVELAPAFWAMAGMALVRAGLRYAEQACNHFIAFKLLALIRDRVFAALRRLCPAKLEGRDKGDLISVITSDIELLEVFYAHTVSPVLIALLFCTVMVILIAWIHPLLAWIAAAAYLCVGLGIPLWISHLSGEDGMRLRSRTGEMSSFVLQSLRGLGEILQYSAGQARLEAMQERMEALGRDEARMKAVTGRNTALTQTVIGLFDLALLALASYLAVQGEISASGAFVALMLLMSSFGPTVALANLGSTLQHTFAAGNRVLDILQETPAAQDVAGCEAADFGEVQVDHVHFGYGDEPVLRDICLQIQPNTVVGIRGRSGSGKSTLLRLMMRFWRTEQGEISVNGRSLEAINTPDLRAMQAFVTQETHLFHDSLAENLRVARPDASEEELREACRKAGIDDFIRSLPQGYDTPVAELGDSLSGGERQRIGLARAFLHDAPLLLLDEPSSNLDSLNEALILRSLEQERGRRTVVLVSHRRSTLSIADQVYDLPAQRRS